MNDGRNNAPDFAPGEFATDTGGFVPFQRYSEAMATGGHYFARNYNAGGTGHPSSFRALMQRSALDLRDLNSVLTSLGISSGILPSTTSTPPTVILDPDVANWNAHHGPPRCQRSCRLRLSAAGTQERRSLSWAQRMEQSCA